MLNKTAVVHSTDLQLNPWMFLSGSEATQPSPEIPSALPDSPEAEWPVVPANADSPETAEGQKCEALDEQDLLDRAREGHSASFDELIQRHYKICVQKAATILHNTQDAEDEVQNACWKAFQHLPQFRGTGSFGAWFWRIVENQCLMRLREGRRAAFLHLDSISESDVRMELVGQAHNPEDALGEREVAKLVRTEISRTPAILRDVMVLADLNGLPLRDVANSLGLSVPAMKSRLCRARKELRARMSKHCGLRLHGTLMQKSSYAQVAYVTRRAA